MTSTDQRQPDPVATRFTARLRQELGERVERIILLGSRDRGDARPDVDRDVNRNKSIQRGTR